MLCTDHAARMCYCTTAQLPGTHAIGATAVTWAPALSAGAILSSKQAVSGPVRRLATCGCDNLIRVSDGGHLVSLLSVP